MSMQQFRKFAIPFTAAAVLALSGVAHAGTESTPHQAPEKVDCKKVPDHKDCKKK
jgi:hypothetical protein